MKRETVETDTWRTDDMHVVCPRAAGLDVHKMCITAAVRLCEAGGGPARTAVREFSALPDGLRAMTDWLREHGVTAAVMEGTGIYWKAPFEALEEAGIRADLLHAQHVRQIRGKKTDTNDSLWLARAAAPPYRGPRRPRRFRLSAACAEDWPANRRRLPPPAGRGSPPRSGVARRAASAGNEAAPRRPVPRPADRHPPPPRSPARRPTGSARGRPAARR